MRLPPQLGLRRRVTALGTAAGSIEGALPIGEPGLEVLPCPGCNRPLPAGTRRCPACGMRFLAGVQLRRAVILLLAGFAVGLAAGGSIVTTGVAAGLPSVLRGPAAAEPTTDAPAAATLPTPTETAAPSATPTIPASARSALLAVAATNERLAAGRVALEASLAAPTFDAVAAAAAIRSVAAEAAGGADQLARLATWPRASGLADDLRAFYDDLRSTARSGLSYSITDEAAYRATAETLAATLDGLAELDARIAVLLDATETPAPRP